MMSYPSIKPYIIKIGSLEVRWYGLMYLFGFIASYLLVRIQIRKQGLKIEKGLVDDLYFYLVLGLIIGARLGYIVFYNLSEYLHNPLEIIKVWHGGMSFHGGLIGSILAGVIFSRKKGVDFWRWADMIIVTAPIGLGLGRLGNFINAELYGRVSTLPWAMVFPGSDGLPRHPSQLYEAFSEGLLLFFVLWFLKDRVKRSGYMVVLFLFFYGGIRFFLEFFREPDPQLGFVVSFLTMGQILCLAMIVAGVFLYLYLKSRKIPARNRVVPTWKDE